jgi:hypothetical protein
MCKSSKQSTLKQQEMKIKFFLGLATISIITVLTGCNKAPQVEIDAAKAAISETQAIGADVYLTEEYAALNDSLNVIMLEVEAKKSKWFAGYNDEKDQLNNIILLANTVRQNTEIRKNEIKEDILVSLSDIKTILDENQALLSEAPKGKEGTAVLVAIKEELSMLNTSVGEIMKMVENGDYLNAQSKVTAVSDKSLAINAELKDAISKYTKRQR